MLANTFPGYHIAPYPFFVSAYIHHLLVPIAPISLPSYFLICLISRQQMIVSSFPSAVFPYILSFFCITSSMAFTQHLFQFPFFILRFQSSYITCTTVNDLWLLSIIFQGLFYTAIHKCSTSPPISFLVLLLGLFPVHSLHLHDQAPSSNYCC